MKKSSRVIALVIALLMVMSLLYVIISSIGQSSGQPKYDIIAQVKKIDKDTSGNVTAITVEEVQDVTYGTVVVSIQSNTAVYNTKTQISPKQIAVGDYVAIDLEGSATKQSGAYKAKGLRIDVLQVTDKT